MKPYLIIGGGLCGLACAVTLHRRGKKVLVLEKREKVGGRVFTRESSSGFLVDEGFQVILTSYPELSRFVDLKNLNLKPFHSGALVFNGEALSLLANPFRHPLLSLKTLIFPSASLHDKALVVKLMTQVILEPGKGSLGAETTLEFLTQFGFSSAFIEDFWKPFLTGVYLDPTLSIGSGFFKFLMRCFAWGEVCLPEMGMNQLPEEIAKHLPSDAIRLGTPVKSWDAKTVTLETDEILEANGVVCAFNPNISSLDQSENYRSATTLYFTSPLLSTIGWDKWLVLLPPRLGFKVSHMALVSSVSSGYSKNNKPLLSVTVTGKQNCDVSTIMKEVEMVAGRTLDLTLVATTEIPLALPVITGEPSGFEHKNGIWFCGDYLASPSINGALQSGRRVAESMLRDS